MRGFRFRKPDWCDCTRSVRRWVSFSPLGSSSNYKAPGSDQEPHQNYTGSSMNEPPSGSLYYFPACNKRYPLEFKDAELPKKENCVPFRMQGRIHLIDTTIPLLSAQELQQWKLDRIIYSTLHHFQPDAQTPAPSLMPPGTTAPLLDPQITPLDTMYRQKGLFAPSEIAELLIRLTPTFFVETRYIISHIPPDVLFVVDQRISRRLYVGFLFAKYPMIFKVHKPRYSSAVVKLNSDMSFIRHHRDYKKGDRLHYKHNAEFRSGGLINPNAPTGDVISTTTTTGTSISTTASTDNNINSRAGRKKHIDHTIFDILVRHLPRGSSSGTQNSSDKSDASLFAPLSLIEWVNSFSPQELEVLNKVPQRRVLLIMSRYVHIFQMMCMNGEEPSIYTDCQELMKHIGSKNSKTTNCLVKGREEEGEEAKDPCAAADASCLAAAPASQGRSPLKIEDDLIGFDDIFGVTSSGSQDVAKCDDGLGVDEEHDEAYKAQDASDEHDQAEEVVDKYSDTFDSMDEADTQKKDSDAGVHAPHDSVGSDGGGLAAREGEDSEEDVYASIALDSLYVRRLPPHIAPRSLSNFNLDNTPDKELLSVVLSFLAPPPSISGRFKTSPLSPPKTGSFLYNGSTGVTPDARLLHWRWVKIEHIYAALTREQRRRLRDYKGGLVGFLRLHGELLELSNDFLHVIAHDPTGTVTPFVPSQKLFCFEERVVLPHEFDTPGNARTAMLFGEDVRGAYERILGASQVPMTRQQLLLLDPLNPILHHDVLVEEVAATLPSCQPVPFTKFFSKLPPILKATMGRGVSLTSTGLLKVWTERGRRMIQRVDTAESATSAHGKGIPAKMTANGKRSSVEEKTAQEAAQPMTLDEAVEALAAAVPVGGATIKALIRVHLSLPVVEALERELGSVYEAVEAYPQFFVVEVPMEDGRWKKGNAVVRLR